MWRNISELLATWSVVSLLSPQCLCQTHMRQGHFHWGATFTGKHSFENKHTSITDHPQHVFCNRTWCPSPVMDETVAGPWATRSLLVYCSALGTCREMGARVQRLLWWRASKPDKDPQNRTWHWKYSGWVWPVTFWTHCAEGHKPPGELWYQRLSLAAFLPKSAI